MTPACTAEHSLNRLELERGAAISIFPDAALTPEMQSDAMKTVFLVVDTWPQMTQKDVVGSVASKNEANSDIQAGRIATFNSVDEMLASLKKRS